MFCTLSAYQRVSQPPLYNAGFSLKVAKYAVFSGAIWPIDIFYPVSHAVILCTNDHSSLFNISEGIQCYQERETALDKYVLKWPFFSCFHVTSGEPQVNSFGRRCTGRVTTAGDMPLMQGMCLHCRGHAYASGDKQNGTFWKLRGTLQAAVATLKSLQQHYQVSGIR